MSTDLRGVRAFVERRLTDISATPEMWGGLEALEFQLLQLIELEAHVEGADPREVLRGWHRHIARRHPGAGPVYLFELTTSAAELVGEILEYRQSRSLAHVFPLFEDSLGRRRASGA